MGHGRGHGLTEAESEVCCFLELSVREPRPMLDCRLTVAVLLALGASTSAVFLRRPRVVALQPRAAAALVPVEGRQVVEAPALLAEALPLPLADDAADLKAQFCSLRYQSRCIQDGTA